MLATANFLTGCLTTILALSASLVIAAPHPTVSGTLACLSAIGEAGSASDSEARREVDRLLQQARQAMREGKFTLVEYYLDRAEKMDVHYDALFARFQDTPQKVRQDLESLRRSQSEAPQPPSARFPATTGPQPQRENTPFAAEPLSPQKHDALLNSLTNDVQTKAKSYLEKGRAAVRQGDTVGAVAWYHKAVAAGATFGSHDYSPEHLAQELRKAGVEPSRLVPPRTLNPQYDPYTAELDRSAADRVPANATNRVTAFVDNPTANPHTIPSNQSLPGLGTSRQYEPPARAENWPSSYIPSMADRPSPPDRLPEISNDLAAQREEAKRRLAQARIALDRGDLEIAYRLTKQAESFGIADSAFSPGETRPWQLLLEIEKAMKRRTGAVIQAGHVEPLGVLENNGEARGRFPVSQGVYDPTRDPTRNMPAAAQQPTPAADVFSRVPEGPAERLLELGIQALEQRDVETARKHFLEAWQYEGQMDPHTRQKLQDYLTQLRPPAAQLPLPVEPSPLEAVNSQQQIMQQKLYREITSEKAAAERTRERDPRGAMDRLQKLRDRVAQSELDPAARKHLLTIVDRAVRETGDYIEQNRAQIELDERNQSVLTDLDRDARMKLEVQNKTAELVEKFNTLMDEQRYAEAEVIAKQARELNGDSEIVQTLLWKSRFARRLESQMSIRQRSEEGFYGQTEAVMESAVPFDDREPYIHGDAKQWQELSNARRKWQENQRQRLSPVEMEIQQALKTKVDVRFTNRPLAEVLDTLGNLSGVNIHLDQQGLHAEGVTSDTPVTLNLTQPISLRSALNLILQELRLSYVIQNEVLNVTSEQTRDSNVYPQVYNVADLVIPIPNFIPSYNVGLPGAIAAAHRALGYGASAPTYGSGPLTVAANGEGMGPATTSASVLAQMGSAGVLGGPRSQQTSQPSAIGPGGMGGGGVADFDSLTQLITSTIAPTSWDDVGGPGSIEGFATNLSLVVSQTQEVHEQIADLLDQLRRLQDLQVTIEVRFITLNDNFFERIGIDFDFSIQDGYKGPLPDDEPPSLVLGLQPTTNFTPPLTGVDSTPDRNIAFSQGSFASAVPQFGGFDAATAANFGFAILSDIEVFFLLQAAQGDQRTNILQAPKVTLFNGQQATISDNSQTPFVTSIIPVVGDFAAAHQPVIVVLSEGTSMNVQAVVSSDRRFVRLTLVPFFSKIGDVKEFTFNGKVTTKSGKAILDPTGKNLLGRNEQETTMEGTTVQLPTFSFTTVTTTVSVPDGGTVLLGGIKRLREGRNERGVPMLSKLPYVNRLFKNVGIGRETQSLMMMVTPRIIIQEEEEEKTVGRPSLP